MKKTILFGGSGFLGSYVADELTRRSYEVVIADIKNSPYLSDKQSFILCDIMDPVAIKKVVKKADVVFNFAGLADIDESIQHPKETFEKNVIGNINILEACCEESIDRFVYASSAYALSDKGSFYGISKLASEKVIEEFQARKNVPYTIVRYGTLYGERADAQNGIYRILRQAVEHGEISHRGDGEAVREFIHAADAAQLSVDIIESQDHINKPIVLTGVERFKHKDLYQMINDILNGSVKISFSGEPWEGHYQMTPYSVHPNLAKKLVPNPFIDLGQGLAQCIQHIYEELQDDNCAAS